MNFMIYLTLMLSALPSFNVQQNDHGNKRITVTGFAQNAKGNAIVVTSAEDAYFLDGVESWHESFYGKKVTVSGRLKLITVEKLPDSPVVAYWYGTRKYLKKPKWGLAEQ